MTTTHLPLRGFLFALLLAVCGAADADAQEAPLDTLQAFVAAHPGDLEARLALARALVANNRQQEAIAQYEAVLQQDSTRLDALRGLAQLYTWNTRPEDAVRAYERIVELDTADVATRLMLAQQYFWTERAREGIRQLESVVRLQPGNLDVRRDLAQHYVWNAMPERAITQYETIAAADTADLATTGRLAQQYLWNSRLAEAVPLYRRIVALRPDSLDARVTLAKALLWTNQTQAAIEQFEQVLKQDPDNREALLLVAEAQRWTPQWPEAREKLQRLLVLDPGNARARELLEGLRADYGPLLQVAYRRITDSNDLTREHIPVTFRQHVDGRWTYTAGASHERLLDERLDAAADRSVTAYQATTGVHYRIDGATTVQVNVSATRYELGWTPLSFSARVDRQFAGRLYTGLQYGRSETREGVRAVQEHILKHDVAFEAYLQATSRLSVSGVLNRIAYSDDNSRLTGVGVASYQVLRRPGVHLMASYGYEDSALVYPTALPYWTPDNLHTTTGWLVLDHTLGGLVRVRARYGVTHQQGVYANNVGLLVGLPHLNDHSLQVEYESSGSDVYAARTLGLSYGYRF